LEHNFLVTCISTPVARKLRLCLLIIHAIIITVAKVLVTARDTQYHFCFKGSYMADETGVPAVDPTQEQVAFTMGALQDKLDQANKYYDKVMKQITKLKDKNMAEILSPGSMMMGGGDGGLGFGSGGGLIGGLILGSLLRNGQGGLFGGGDGAAAGAVLRSPPEQNQANMDLMAAIGGVDKAVAVSQAAIENSNSMQTNMLSGQLSQVAQATVGQINSLKDVVNQNSVALMQGQAAIQQNIMENRYELSKDISADGEKTRALITNQYEINLQRQLADANAAIIELRSRENAATIGRGVEVTTTNNINQMQSQQQQQSQFGQLANLIYGLSQSIRSNNEAINVGSGTLTANPTNTNTNIR
jgi:hypothetical protein